MGLGDIDERESHPEPTDYLHGRQGASVTKRRKPAKKSTVAKKTKPAKKATLAKKAKASKVKVSRRPSHVKKRGVKPAQSKTRTKRGKPARKASTKPRRAPLGFARGPTYVAVKRRLGREPEERELKPTTRDYAIVDVLVQALKWQGRANPLMDAKTFATMREALSPAGDAMLQRRSVQYMSRQAEAEKRAERAYRNGTLDREYIRIANETGLTPREVYSLGISPPSMGVAA